MADHNYSRPEMLVETDWLVEHLQDVCIVDCDNREAYRRAHIPGAVTFRGHHYLKEKEGAPHIMGPEQFAEPWAGWGSGTTPWSSPMTGSAGCTPTRLWWALNYYGHTRAAVLNGGWDAWLAEGRPLTNAPARRAAARFSPQVNEELIARWEYVRDSIDQTDRVLLDVRSDGEWSGQNARGTKRGGRIPGAVHLEWLNYVDDQTKKFKPATELRAMFAEAGITPESQVVTY